MSSRTAGSGRVSWKPIDSFLFFGWEWLFIWKDAWKRWSGHGYLITNLKDEISLQSKNQRIKNNSKVLEIEITLNRILYMLFCFPMGRSSLLRTTISDEADKLYISIY
jgi:hypothetical protein